MIFSDRAAVSFSQTDPTHVSEEALACSSDFHRLSRALNFPSSLKKTWWLRIIAGKYSVSILELGSREAVLGLAREFLVPFLNQLAIP